MQEQLKETYQLSTSKGAFEFLRNVLASSYPLAVWRLPQTDKLIALVDLTSNEAFHDREIENLDKSFVINGYCDTHPTNPMVLRGDILLEFDSDDVSMTVNPTLSAEIFENFQHELASTEHKKLKNFTTCNHPDYPAMVAEAVDTIKEGKLHKVVLSRFEDFDLPDGFDPFYTLQKLSDKYENAFCYLINTKTYGCWIGATPEKLIALKDNQFFSTDALAGTQVLPEDKELCDVAWTQKEIEEQAMVSRYIIDCFKKIRLREFDEIGPKTVKAGNLTHLKTEFKVDMQSTNSPLLGSTMLELLHPTSAVCGMPRELADEFIKAHEDYERSLYAGFLGPAGFGGNTNLFVNLRCMQVNESRARLYAGAGITENSNPQKELEETSHKMQTLLKVLQE